MEISIKENGWKTRNMEKASTNGKMEIHTKAIGGTIKWMEKVFSLQK